jgi:hypothetical protein
MSGLKEPVLKLMARTYEPKRIVELSFGRYDLAFKTDEEGRPVLLFLGKKDTESGKINGERYARRLVFDDHGMLIKDHWNNRGKATAQL